MHAGFCIPFSVQYRTIALGCRGSREEQTSGGGRAEGAQYKN